MCWPTTDARGGSLYAALSLLALAPVPAQGPVEPAAAIERWLTSEHTSESLMTATVEAVCDAPDGLKVLGKKLQALQVTPGEPRSKGLRSLMPKVALEHLRRTYKSGMTYAGQYGGLASLQPWIGPFLFGLLLGTPEWYPLTFRVRLVPAIRDLQQQLPDAARVAGITRLVEDERVPGMRDHALKALEMVRICGRPVVHILPDCSAACTILASRSNAGIAQRIPLVLTAD